ncbi:unnamed protein product [Musa acuminata subsp. malaccensis]|uniref:(wild Malaysian banana) hypothetical protein n=1 Tax=Musa acuminata subsp. malaccensis TaxID=214687 RepID=A0A8D7AVD7_MUSAM|nr:unnamed protein product [Musa acuminata subsp. malaccensis]
MEWCSYSHRHHHHHHHHHAKGASMRLENIEEERPASCLPVSLRPPETPTEAMEFLARSWSLSAVEISKALTLFENRKPSDSTGVERQNSNPPLSAAREENPAVELKLPVADEGVGVSPPISPRDNIDLKLLRGAARGKTMGGWLKDQKEKRRTEARTRKAQAYAATSVAGVAAAVAAVVASAVFSPDASRTNCGNKITAAIASAAALVASHCVEIAQTMGAAHDQILKVVHSAVGAQTSGDIMALTAGAATALRGAATLRARLYKEIQGATAAGDDKESSDGCSSAFTFVAKGGELVKRTRKGILHWKQVSVYINSNWQVVVKTKSTHMAGTFVKKKKCKISFVIDVCANIPAWPGREVEDGSDQRAYFGIRTPERLIEFECKKCDEGIWIEGIRQMLDCRANMNIAKAM